MHIPLVNVYLLNVLSVSSPYFSKTKQTSCLGKWHALSLEILWTRGFLETVKLCKTATQKKDKTNIFMTNGSLMKVESIAECFPLEHSAILLTCIKQ